MSDQPSFQFARDEFIAYAAPTEAQPRLSAQCQRILERLRQGPATNRELARIALKYTSRISDLRAAGHRIDRLDYDPRTGECWYRLEA